jgi:hypothetical protein
VRLLAHCFVATHELEFEPEEMRNGLLPFAA